MSLAEHARNFLPIELFVESQQFRLRCPIDAARSHRRNVECRNRSVHSKYMTWDSSCAEPCFYFCYCFTLRNPSVFILVLPRTVVFRGKPFSALLTAEVFLLGLYDSTWLARAERGAHVLYEEPQSWSLQAELRLRTYKHPCCPCPSQYIRKTGQGSWPEVVSLAESSAWSRHRCPGTTSPCSILSTGSILCRRLERVTW